MEPVRVDTKNYKFNKEIPPAVTVPSGSLLTFVTKDCFGGQITKENETTALAGADFNWDVMNPTCGPVAVEGAKTGDVLKVEIWGIEVTGPGVLATGKGFGVCCDYFDKLVARVVDIKNNNVDFMPGVKIPIRPMIGVIGTAPAGDPINNGWPGDHGGNMDCNMIGEGATVYLPVLVDGGLLSIGDVHAIQGDGEICGTGAECPAEVTVKVELLKNFDFPTPFVENDCFHMPVASKKTLDEAVSQVVINGVDFLMKEYAMTRFDAAAFCSLAADVKICQVVDPLMTARIEIPKKLLKRLK